MLKIRSGIKIIVKSWLLHKKSYLSFGVFALFLISPLFGLGHIAKSDNEQIYSPLSNKWNSQTVSLLSPRLMPSSVGGTGGPTEITTTDDGALVSTDNPSADKEIVKIAEASTEDISVYVVRPGDSLGTIADMFDVTVSTIRGFNNIRKDSDLKPGMELLILPIDGISYKVAKGDTLMSVAKKFTDNDSDAPLLAADISLFNDVPEDGSLIVGSEIVIPNASSDTLPPDENIKPIKPKAPVPSKTTGGKGYFVKAWGGIMSQDFHDTYRARDFAMPLGSKVGASASGKVIRASMGWGGGYGNYIIISHPNGAQTLYAHLSKLLVSEGDVVTQRQTIGLSGSTGRSTGPHLHFEIRHWGDIPFK